MPDHGSMTPAESVSVDAPQFEVAARNPKRAEKVVVACFVISGIAFACFGGAFWQNADNEWLGGTIGAGMLFFGAGFVAWGKYLMPRGPFEEPRPMMEATKAEHDAFVSDFATRGRVAIRRRVLLAKAMGFGGAIFGVVALFPLVRSLGPLPKRSLYTTKWKRGSALTTTDGRRVHVDDVQVGGIVTVFPENDIDSAISQTVLIHAQPHGDIVTKPGRETWAPGGYIAYSKVCTHAGCPVGLYEKTTQRLLCPCHQSLFDIYTGATPVFGPAPRPLAQLPLYIDPDGYIRAQSDYDEPIGPGFFERGGTT
jgi:ubiquinol-cytochrome c reductase iron-sulfur subunit